MFLTIITDRFPFMKLPPSTKLRNYQGNFVSFVLQFFLVFHNGQSYVLPVNIAEERGNANLSNDHERNKKLLSWET